MNMNRAVTFVRVVETGGFTRAAESLGLPASSVSRAVSKLELELGVSLLDRNSRHVSLTDAGRAFFDRARDALVGLNEASDLALDAAREPYGVVRVALPPELGSMHGALFARFGMRHPRIRIELTFTPRGAELVGDLVDLAVAIGKLPDSALVAKKLGHAAHKLYAAPGYVAKHGLPKRLADLAKHDVILSRAIGGEARWELSGPKGAEHVDVTARLVADHVHLVMDATLAGLGIALLPTTMGDRVVAARELSAILPRYEIDTPVYLLAHSGRHLPHRVALLRDELIAALPLGCKEHG
ncbi:MAG: transcriptional regulator, LysR family [Myxococcales bacterium]|nr:transcriptional regulator, LysR family [Myxococcales bacterium]